MEFIEHLKRPFPPEKISWRVGSTNKDKTKGLALAYIDARDVMQRLDDALGPTGWQNRYSHVCGHGVICEIGVYFKDTEQWIWKANGAGETQVEAQKGAASDAFKRAAVLWGVGRYLYDLKSPWVKIVPFGKSYKIDDGEFTRLSTLLPPEFTLNEAKQWLLDASHMDELSSAWKDVQAAGFSRELAELKDKRKKEISNG